MNDARVSELLHTWQPHVCVPAALHARVWERIAERQAARDRTPLVRLRHWITSMLLRPGFVLALGMVMISVGIGAGWWMGTHDRADEWARLETRYVSRIDPYTHAHSLR